MLRFLYFPYKYLIFVPVVVLSTTLIGSLIILLSVIYPSLDTGFLARLWARCNMYATPAQVRVHGLEHLQDGQSYVVVANHLSQFDILALYGWLDLDLKWVMKKELRKVPVLGAACAAMGHVFIDRKDTEQAVNTLKEARARLHDGTSVLFFPEGTRSADGRMSPFKKGAFMMAKDIELPILPLTLIGTEKVLPNGGFDLLPGTIDLVIHAPISAQDVKTASAMALRLESQNRIASALAHDQVPQELV